MRVSLAPARPSPTLSGLPGGAAAEQLLLGEGPSAILGESDAADGLAVPIAPGPASLFGPRGACLAGAAGPLFVCDTGHHRLLIWRKLPEGDGVPADALLGQPDFHREGRNAKAEVGPATFNVPTGIATADGVLAVADAWNHRVLIWHGYPDRDNRLADVVLGQSDFAGGLANRGSATAGPDSLNWCYGVALVGGRLYVADTGNRRVLIWDRIPEANGTPADLVLGQKDMATRDENAGGLGGGLGMRWPHGIAMAGDRLFVADAGSSRIMIWSQLPAADGTPCDAVLGQTDMDASDHNRGAYYPGADSLSMPYGICSQGDRLVVADTANSRLLGFELGSLATGAAARRLAGQKSFAGKGDNRWKPRARDSLCWPYGVAACGDHLAIADSGNNRVMLWRAAP